MIRPCLCAIKDKDKGSFTSDGSASWIAKATAPISWKAAGIKSYADVVKGRGSGVSLSTTKPWSYAEVPKGPANGAAARTWAASGPKANLLSAEVNAAAAFQALASVRFQEEIEISAIAANDTTIPLNEGKGDAAGKGRNVIDGQEATDCSNSNGNGGEADDDYQGGGEPNDEGDGFVWNKKARKAAEKHLVSGYSQSQSPG